jgi:hypothetical protein
MKPVLTNSSCSCLSLIGSYDYLSLVNTNVNADICELWNAIFCITPKGNLYTKTIIDRIGCTNVLFEPWRYNQEPEKEMVGFQNAEDPMFNIPFEKLQPLMVRRIQYSMPLKHSIPLGNFSSYSSSKVCTYRD